MKRVMKEIGSYLICATLVIGFTALPRAAHAQIGAGAGGAGMAAAGIGGGMGGSMGGGNVGTATGVGMNMGANTANAGAFVPNSIGGTGFGGQNINTATTTGMDVGDVAAGAGINPLNGAVPRRFGQNFNTAIGMDMNPGTPSMIGGGQTGFQGFYRNLRTAGNPGLFNRSGYGRSPSSMFSNSNQGYGIGYGGGWAGNAGMFSSGAYGRNPPTYAGSSMFRSMNPQYTQQVSQPAQSVGGSMLFGFPGNYNRGYYGGGGGAAY